MRANLMLMNWFSQEMPLRINNHGRGSALSTRSTIIQIAHQNVFARFGRPPSSLYPHKKSISSGVTSSILPKTKQLRSELAGGPKIIAP